MGQTLMAGDSGAVENNERKARELAHVNFFGGQASGGTDRIVAGELDVRQLRISTALAFVDDHSQHLSHFVVNALHTTVAAWMVEAGGDFSITKKLIYDVGKLSAEQEAVVREDATWTPPKGNVPVDKDVGRAFSCNFSDGDGEHVGTTAKSVGEKKNIVVTPGRDRQWPKVVHASRNAPPRREENRNDGPSNRRSRFKQWRNHRRVNMLIPIHQ